MPRDKVRLTSSKDTAGSATFGAMSPLFPMQLSSSVPGRGVTGLSLVRGLAELHGGKAWLESDTGQGTRAYVYFPVANSPEMRMRDRARA